MCELNPVLWSPKVCYEYSAHSSNTLLWPHIELHHLLLYTQLAEKYGWKIQLPGIVKSQSALTDGAPSLANSQREDRFTEQSFHEHLINFIVADDQVCKVQFALLSN